MSTFGRVKVWDGTNVASVSGTNLSVVALQTGAWTVTATPSGTQDVNVVNTVINVTASGGSIPVTGTFWQATQPIGGTVSVSTGLISLSGTSDVNIINGSVNVTASGGSIPVTGSFYQATQPISGTVNVFNVLSATGVLIAAMTTGTVNVVNTVAISGTATVMPSGTQDVNVTNVLSATGVVVASVTTGTMDIANVPNVHAYPQTDILYNATTGLTPKFAVIDSSTSGDNVIITSVGGKKLRVLQFGYVVAGDMVVRFESSEGGTAMSGQMEHKEGSGMNSGYNPFGHFETTAGHSLNIELSTAISIDGYVVYVEV